MKKAAIYARVSTADQNLETQLHDLRQFASQRGLEIAGEYMDCISGVRATRPALDQLMSAVYKRQIDCVLVWSCDRLARSTKHFLETLDQFNRAGIEFLSFREQLDTAGPLGRAVVIIIGAIAELERNLIRERVKAGMRRARAEGRPIGRRPLDVDREQIHRDRGRGLSLGQIARLHKISRTSAARILKQPCPERLFQTRLQGIEAKDTGFFV